MRALTKMNVNVDTIILEKPKSIEFGDISTNLAMQLARQLKKSPGILHRK